MQGYKRAFMATVATLLLANAAFAQNIAPVSAPIITNVTPGDASGTIGFVPSRVTEGTPPVREYVVSCETIGVSDAGTIETTADVQTLIGNSVTVQGLTNGDRYQCTMVARAVTGGIVPRAINSEPSNASPVFSPSPNGGETIFVRPAAPAPAPEAEAPAATLPAEPVAVAPIAQPVVAAPAPKPEVSTAVEPLAVREPAPEPTAEMPVAKPVVVEVPTATPVAATPPAVEEKAASSAVRSAVSAILAGVVSVALFV